MRKHILFAVFTVFSSLALAQYPMGNIQVNNNFTATLNFTDSVKLTIFGNNPPTSNGHFKYYDVFQTGRSCIIRGNDPAAPLTSINVKLANGNIWFGTIKYGDSTKVFYSFVEPEAKRPTTTPLTNAEAAAPAASPQESEARIKERMDSVMAEPAEYSSIGAIENGLVFQVANIKNDDSYTYFKLIVSNNTGSDYNLDGAYFKVVEGKRKGFKRNEAKIEQRVQIVHQSTVKVIKAYSTEQLGFVIQRFTGGKNGTLTIQLRELKGTRNPNIEIPGSKMLNVQVFE